MRFIKAITNKNGSSVIMVLIAMTFIAILGTILMFAAFTGYQIKVAQARGEDSFYDAETALDEIRAGVQGVVTQCIAKAYTDMLLGYTHEMNLEEVFKKNFADEFKKSSLLIDRGEYYDYEGAVLSGFVSSTTIETSFSYEVIITSDTFTLKDVTVRHRSVHGYVSYVSTDIVVIIPDFSYVRNAYTISGIPQFALIANQELTIPAATASTNGNTYAGQVKVNTGAFGSFTIADGTFISKGDILIGGEDTVAAGGIFNMAANSVLWANRIVVGENSSTVLLNGQTYVADDLVLQGAEAYASMMGSYFGFGVSHINAANSSSIIINGMGSTLDMSELHTLFLAGNSFIDTGNADDNVIMGQSISVKSDQLAYLVPISDISLRMNPIIFQGAEPPFSVTSGIEYKKVFRYISSTDQTLLYLFMEFEDRDNANAYFADYFSQNADEIKNYVDLYLEFYHPAQYVQAAGYYYTVDGDNITQIGNPYDINVIANSSNRLSLMFNNLTRSLSANIQINNDITPFEYIVKEPLPNGITVFEENGVARAVIINNNQEYSVSSIKSTYGSGINLILSMSDITVDEDFKGLIISNSKIILQANATADPTEIIPSMRAVNGDRVFADYLNLKIVDAEGSGSGTSSWDMNSLVHFENWRKN
ncbi:MAG: hypothetical protein FWD34_10630 [Oscillospiraceae bacterium]|nr:hypothetical protein [Oscillospiraceae bacterium]